MAPSFGTSSPADKLAKAERDLERLRIAEKSEDAVAMGDALGDLAVGLTELKDWLKAPGVPAADVESEHRQASHHHQVLAPYSRRRDIRSDVVLASGSSSEDGRRWFQVLTAQDHPRRRLKTSGCGVRHDRHQ
jgi:hypothetical protein